MFFSENKNSCKWLYYTTEIITRRNFWKNGNYLIAKLDKAGKGMKLKA